jgi:hypothetical protein
MLRICCNAPGMLTTTSVELLSATMRAMALAISGCWQAEWRKMRPKNNAQRWRPPDFEEVRDR